MSKDKNIVCFSDIQLREIFNRAGLNSLDIERAIADYTRYRESELSSLSLLSYRELQNLGKDVFKGLKQGGEIVDNILREYFGYIDYKKEMAETYQESKDWGLVFSTSCYSDVKEAQESFIDYVEEVNQTKVKNRKHLQELTGITHLDSWNKKAGKYVTPDTEIEAKENAIRELEDTITGSRYSKYSRSFKKKLQEGAKYKDLLLIEPKDFNLPETWSGTLAKDKYSSMLCAISSEYLISEKSLMLLPNLRSIAEELEAPYSVLMDCYKLYK